MSIQWPNAYFFVPEIRCSVSVVLMSVEMLFEVPARCLESLANFFQLIQILGAGRILVIKGFRGRSQSFESRFVLRS